MRDFRSARRFFSTPTQLVCSSSTLTIAILLIAIVSTHLGKAHAQDARADIEDQVREALQGGANLDEAGVRVLFDPQPPRDYELAQAAYRRGEPLSNTIQTLRDSIDDFDNSTNLRHQIGLIPQRALLGECLRESGDLGEAMRQYQLAMQQVVRLPAFLAQVAWPDVDPILIARENVPGTDAMQRDLAVNAAGGPNANGRRGLWRSAAVLLPSPVPPRFLVANPGNPIFENPGDLTLPNLLLLQGVDIHEVLAMALLAAHRRTMVLSELAASDETLARTASALTPPMELLRPRPQRNPDRARQLQASLASRQVTVATQRAMQWLLEFQQRRQSDLNVPPADEALTPIDQQTLDADSVTRVSARTRILHVQRSRARAANGMQSTELLHGQIRMLQQAADHAAAVGRPETVVESMRLAVDLAEELPNHSVFLSDLSMITERMISAYDPMSPVVASQLRVIHARFLRKAGQTNAALAQLTLAERTLNASQSRFLHSLARLNRVREQCLHEQIEATLRVPIKPDQEVANSRSNRMAESASAMWRNFAINATPSHPAAFREARFLILTARNVNDDLPIWRQSLHGNHTPILWDRFDIACARNSINLDVAARGIAMSSRTNVSGDVLTWIDQWLSRRGLAMLGPASRGIDFYAALRLPDNERADAIAKDVEGVSVRQTMLTLARLDELDRSAPEVFDPDESTRRRQRMDRIIASEVASGIVAERLVPPSPPERDGRTRWPRLPRGTVVACMAMIEGTMHVVVCQDGHIGHHRVSNAMDVIRQLNQFLAVDAELRADRSRRPENLERQRDQLRLEITRAIFPPLRSFDLDRCKRLLIVPDNEIWNAPLTLWASPSDVETELREWASEFLIQVSPTPSFAFASAVAPREPPSAEATFPSILVQTRANEERFQRQATWLRSFDDMTVNWGFNVSPGGSRDWSKRHSLVSRLDPGEDNRLDVHSTRPLKILVDLHTPDSPLFKNRSQRWQTLFDRSFRAHAAGVQNYWVNRRVLSEEATETALEELLPELPGGRVMDAWQRYQAIQDRLGTPILDQVFSVSGQKILADDE